MTRREKTDKCRELRARGVLLEEELNFVEKHEKILESARRRQVNGRRREKDLREKVRSDRISELRKKQQLTEDERLWLEEQERKDRPPIERRIVCEEHKAKLLAKENPSPEDLSVMEKEKEKKAIASEKRKKKWAENRDLMNEKQRERRKKLTPEQKRNNTKTATLYRAKRCAVDPAFLLLTRARTRAWKFLRRVEKLKTEHGTGFQKHFGTTKAIFFDYMNPKLLEGMSWENYGEVWHMDHIVPLSLGGANEERLLKLGHYKNLQPMFAADNVRKGDSMPAIWPEGVPFTRGEVESWAKE